MSKNKYFPLLTPANLRGCLKTVAAAAGVLVLGCALPALSAAAGDGQAFASDLGGVADAKAIFNPGSRVVIDGPAGCLRLSGTTDDQSTYLGVELNLVKIQDLTRQAVCFEFKGDPGDLYVRMFNSGDSKECMSFAGYKRIEPSEWRGTKLQMKAASGGFRLKGGGVDGKAPGEVDRIHIVYKPEKKNEPVRLEIRNLKLEEDREVEFKRIIAPELKVSDIKLAAEVTALIKDGRPVAKVIVPAERPLSAAEEQAVKLLNEKYGVQFDSYKLKEGQITLPDGDYILFGDGVRGLIVNRLLACFYLAPDRDSYEVRNIRNAFQGNCNILYFGGMPEDKMLEGVQRFIARQEKTGNELAIGKYVDAEKYNSPENAAEDEAPGAEAVKKIKAVYADETIEERNTPAIRVVSNLARRYNNTGDEKLVEPFMQMLRIMAENYESAKPWRKTPPSDRGTELAFAIDLMDESESLTDKDLVFCGNLLRQITEDCMNYYEMRDPMRLYDSMETEYLTNHPLAASRSVSAMGRFLQKRFNIPAADYWIAVSAHAYKETAKADQSPEDSGFYQWSCRKIYNQFALQSGAAPLLTPNFKGYIDFAIAHFNQMGRAASYGDAKPMKEIVPMLTLIDSCKYYNDPLSGHILNSVASNDAYVSAMTQTMGLPKDIKYEPRMLGLTVFPLCDFLKKYDKIETGHELLNKAVFRSGYEPSDEYIMLDGVNKFNDHGHLDGNAIIEYSRGDRYWLVDGHYVKKFPREHNTITVSRDGILPDQRGYASAPAITKDNFAEISGSAAAPDGSCGITATLLSNYNGTDWTRNIFWSSLNGFWVIDRLDAKESGRYVIKCIWRTLGDVTLDGGAVAVAQKKADDGRTPDRLVIARGDSAATVVSEQLDAGHNGPFGYYDSYQFAGPLTKVISEVNDLDLKAGERLDYVNFFETGYGADTKTPQICRAGESAWIADGKTMQLAALGGFKSPEMELQAERALVSPEGILAINAMELRIGNQIVALPSGKTFHGKFGEGVLRAVSKEQIRKVLTDVYTGSKGIELQKIKTVSAPELPAERKIETPAPVKVMAVSDDRVVCGFEDGSVIGYDLKGSKLWESKLNAPVTALCPVEDGGKTLWAAGARYDNRESKTGCVALISDEGTLLWQNPVSPYTFAGATRPGTIRTVTAAKLLPGESQQIVAGSESWKYIAFDLAGKKLWSFPVLHAATVCAAGDMTGDGLDEIAGGTEYPTHWIISHEGKPLKTINSGNGDSCVMTSDVTGDGKKAAVFGREDGFIKVMRPGELDKYYLWEANVGGLPTGITEAPNSDLAVSTENNAVVFVNRSGQKTGTVCFPEHLCGIKNINGSLYTICRDGYVYRFSEKEITGKFKIPGFRAELQPPLLDAAGSHPVAAFGKQIIILK